MDRIASRTHIIEALTACKPPVIPCRWQLQILQHRIDRPPLIDSIIDQMQQIRFSGRVHSYWDRATQSPCSFPCARINRIANSLTASDSLAISAREAASSISRRRSAGPGRDAANGTNATNAPSWATRLIRTITDRSTPTDVAACATVTSCRSSYNQISYFSDGTRNFFPARETFITVDLQSGPTVSHQMRRNQNPNLYR